MARGIWSATQNSAEIVPALKHRRKLTIQLQSGDETAISIGNTAIFGYGYQLVNVGDDLVLEGPDAEKAIYAVCNTGNLSSGGWFF